MKDTTFGNVESNLSYDEMIELVEQLKVGDEVKIRGDLIEGCAYSVSTQGEFDVFEEEFTSIVSVIQQNEVVSVNKIDTNDKSINVGKGEYWIPYNMINIDWLFEQKGQVLIAKSEEEGLHKCECVEGFYQQAQELNGIAQREMEEAVFKLNEAICKLNAINKDISVYLSNGQGMCCVNSINIKQDTPRSVRLIVE